MKTTEVPKNATIAKLPCVNHVYEACKKTVNVLNVGKIKALDLNSLVLGKKKSKNSFLFVLININANKHHFNTSKLKNTILSA